MHSTPLTSHIRESTGFPPPIPLFGDLLLHGDRTLPKSQLGNMSGSLGLPQNPCCSPATSIPRALCIHKDVCAMQFCAIDPPPSHPTPHTYTASINLWRLGARNERHALRQPAVASRCVSSMPAPPQVASPWSCWLNVKHRVDECQRKHIAVQTPVVHTSHLMGHACSKHLE